MPRAFGPATVSVPTAYRDPHNTPASYDESLANHVVTIPVLTGNVISSAFTGAVKDAGGPNFDLYYKWLGDPPNVWASTNNVVWASVASGGGPYTFTAPHGGDIQVVLLDGGGGPLVTGGTGHLNGFTVDTTGSLPTYCAYGTRIRADLPYFVTIVPDVILTIIGALTDGWAWAIGVLFMGQTLNLQNLCSTVRGAQPIITTDDVIAAATFPPIPASATAYVKLWDWFKWAAWPTFCECVPGTPSPTPPPDVFVDPPTGMPPSPVESFTCDPSNLCANVEQLTLAVTALTQGQRQIANLVQLIQRQHVPFGSIPGMSHTGLTGSGTLSVQGILGLSVTPTVIPGYLSATMAPVNSYYRLGEISLGTAAGWERRMIVTHNPHLFTGIDGDITLVGYLFEPGVTATIQELVREP